VAASKVQLKSSISGYNIKDVFDAIAAGGDCLRGWPGGAGHHLGHQVQQEAGQVWEEEDQPCHRGSTGGHGGQTSALHQPGPQCGHGHGECHQTWSHQSWWHPPTSVTTCDQDRVTRDTWDTRDQAGCDMISGDTNNNKIKLNCYLDLMLWNKLFFSLAPLGVFDMEIFGRSIFDSIFFSPYWRRFFWQFFWSLNIENNIVLMTSHIVNNIFSAKRILKKILLYKIYCRPFFKKSWKKG